MKDSLFGFFTITIACIFICAVGYGLWTVGKRVNYKLQYHDMVVETVRDNVKQECLK